MLQIVEIEDENEVAAAAPPGMFYYMYFSSVRSARKAIKLSIEGKKGKQFSVLEIPLLQHAINP